MTDTRFITCEACGGEGRDLRGITDEDHGVCLICDGEAVVEIEVEQITLDDLGAQS
jgi:hypothetical protein